MKPVQRRWKIKIDVYECTAHLEVVPTNTDVGKRVNALCKKSKLPLLNEEGDESWGQTLFAFDNYYIVISKESLKDWNSFFHEFQHLIDGICEDRDVQDSEARAYLAGCIGDFFLQKLLTQF